MLSLEELDLALLEEIGKRVRGIPRYMTYPKNQPTEGVEEHHYVGEAQHIDFRYKLNGWLEGWSIVGGRKGKEVSFEYMQKNLGKGLRAEMKARQPCIATDTYVIKNQDLIPAGELEVGDLVLTVNGTFQPVIRIDKVMKDEQYVIKLRHGLPVQVDGDHPFLVNDVPTETFEKLSKKQRRVVKSTLKPVWKSARDIKPEDILLCPKVKARGWVGGKELGLLIGYYLGDGNLSRAGPKNKQGEYAIPYCRLYFNSKQPALINKYKEVLKQLGIHYWQRVRKDNVTELRFTASKWLSYLPSPKEIPVRYIIANEEFIRGVIEGLVDSDGYTDSSGKKYVTNANLSILNGLVLMLHRLGLAPSIRYRPNWNYQHTEKQGMIGEVAWSESGKRDYFDYGDYLGFRVRSVSRAPPKPLVNIVTPNHTFCLPYCATHNTDWLFPNKKEGESIEIEPGSVGAGVEAPGTIKIVSRLQVWVGALKPYFKEYFLKGGSFKDWTRLVIRAVKAPRLEPETKTPTGKVETFWRAMIPKDQMPYAIKRGMEKGWVAPKIPFPLDWAKKLWPEQVTKWEEWVKDKKPTLGTVALSIQGRYSLLEHSYMGPVHIRGMEVKEWHLLIDDGKERVRDLVTQQDNPLYVLPVAFVDRGRIAKKWFDYEGKLKPQELWNPTKSLESKVRKLASGKAIIKINETESGETIELQLTGGMGGSYLLVQEEPDSDFYTLFETESLQGAGGEEARFVYDEHRINDKPHWDLRLALKEGIEEFSGLDRDLRELGIEEPVEGILKPCNDPSWVDPEFTEGERKVGNLTTYVKRLDQGRAIIFNRGDTFWSLWLFGDILNGYYIARKLGARRWIIMKSKTVALASEPKPYSEPTITQKRGWDKFRVDLFDPRDFTRAVEPDMVPRYLEQANLTIPRGVEILIGLYPRPNKIHGARIMSLFFDINEWTVDKALEWIEKQKLTDYSWDMIRRV